MGRGTNGIKFLPKKIRIYHIFDGHCGYCGKKMELKELTRDHIVPYCTGASLRNNMMPSCARCNSLKNNLSLEEFRNSVFKINDMFVKKSGFIKHNQSITFYFETFKGLPYSVEALEASITRMLAEESMKRMFKILQK